MVRFYLGEGTRSEVQQLLDLWSHNHPDNTMGDVELSYTVSEDGNWRIALVCEEEYS